MLGLKRQRPGSRHARWLGYALISLMLSALTACGSSAPANTTHSGPINAVTTMSVLADMIHNVGGERVRVRNIIPLGAGPEDYQPTPEAARAVAEADIVFYNGFGLEEWLGDLFAGARRPGQPQVAVAEGLEPLDRGAAFAQGNPHFWMSAALGARYAERIRDGLIGVDPAGRASYTANAERYIGQLLALNAELKQQAAALPPAARKLVTNHDAFPYFAREYGFTIVGNLLGNAEAEPSASDLAALVGSIKAQRVKAVFGEAQFSPKLAEALASEAQVRVVTSLYTDTLGEPGTAGASYVEMLRYDMRAIVEVLR